MDQVQVR